MSDRSADNATAPTAQVPWDSIAENAPDAQWEGEAPAEPINAALSAAPDVVAPPESDTHLHNVVPAPEIRGGGWTLPLLCAGLALIACCVLIPQADANRRLAYERQMLKMDLDSVEKQVQVNDEFLKKVAADPALAQRLAERQMKLIPEGTRVLELAHQKEGDSMSPFQLVSVAPAPPLPPYKPVGGLIAHLCYDAKSRLYVIGAALLLMATGLVMGYAPPKQS